ncbi:MAG: DMT family transporter [Candidatus Micrarchaeia archaeon]
MDEISLGILLGLVAMFGFGISDALAKLPLVRLGGAKVIFIRNLFISAIFLAAILFIHPDFGQIDYSFVALAIIISAIAYFPLSYFYRGLKVGEIGLVTPVAHSSIIITAILSVIFFHEALTQLQICAIALIFFGLVLISINFKDIKSSQLFKLSSGIPYALITGILWGLVYFLIKIPILIIGPILCSFILEFVILCSSAAHIFLSKQEFKFDLKGIWRPMLALSVLSAVASFALNFGIGEYNVSIVAALAFASPLVATLYARFAYHEKLTSLQWVAVLIILVGVVALAG